MTRAMIFARAALALGALVATDLLVPMGTVFGPAPAAAVVGRPATPVSVAGVARRTTRRTVVATSAVVAATPPPATTVVVVETAPPPAGQQQQAQPQQPPQ